jgi:hypothetical protein
MGPLCHYERRVTFTYLKKRGLLSHRSMDHDIAVDIVQTPIVKCNTDFHLPSYRVLT